MLNIKTYVFPLNFCISKNNASTLINDTVTSSKNFVIKCSIFCKNFLMLLANLANLIEINSQNTPANYWMMLYAKSNFTFWFP